MRIFFIYIYLFVKVVVNVVVSIIIFVSGGIVILLGLVLGIWDFFVYIESYKYNVNIVI